MNQAPLLKILPLVVIAVVVTGGLVFLQKRAAMQERLKDLLERAQKEATTKLPEPTPFIAVRDQKVTVPSLTPAASPTPTPKAVTSQTETPAVTVSPDQAIAAANKNKTVIISQSTVCTPVYGAAETCAEHAVVDTAVDTSIFYNLAGLSYLSGLLAFIKAKRA